MKKLLIIILLLISAKYSFSQRPCYARPGYSVNYATNEVMLADSSVYHSYNYVHNLWQIYVGGAVYSFADTTYFNIPFDSSLVYQVCLTIWTEDPGTDDTCSSRTCQYLDLNNNCGINATWVTHNATTNTSNDGSIDLTVTGNNPPYTFSWSNGETTEDITNASYGYQSVLVSSVSNPACQRSFVISVGADTMIFTPCIQATWNVQNASVQTGIGGFIDLTPISNTPPPYSFLWSTGDTTEDIFNLAPGNYWVYIQSVNDQYCRGYYTINVGLDSNTYPCYLQLSAVVNHVSVIGGNDGSIDLTITGARPPIAINWSTGDTTEDLNNLSAGHYSVYVFELITIPINPPPPTCFASFDTWILEPYAGTIIDTLQTSVLDSCFGFQVDTFYVSSISVNGSIVTVNWVFIGGGQVVYIPVDYTFTNYGSQMIILTVNCPFKKSISTYTTYINIRENMGIVNEFSQTTLFPYPNPAGNSIAIDLPSGFSDKVSLNVYNNLGDKILDTPFAKNSKLNIESLAPGFYYIKITDNLHKSQAVGKFIKQ